MKSRQGFTFIETMIVVGIIALLSTAVVVGINPVKRFEDARNKQKEIHLQTLLSAIEQKRTLEGGWFGIDCEPLPCATTSIPLDEEEEEGEMNPDFKTIGTLRDPANPDELHPDYYDLFSCLVPKYMPKPLYDPDGGNATDTHYQIWQNPQTKYVTLRYVKETPYKRIVVGPETYRILSEPRNVVTTGVDTDTIGHYTAVGIGAVDDDGGAYITEAGMIWVKAVKFNYSVDEAREGLKFESVDMEEIFRTGETEGRAEPGISTLSITSNIHSLEGGDTQYFVRAYAKNEIGVGYGDIVTFNTLDDRPEVYTDEADPVGYDMAVINGRIETLGIAPVSEAFFCWDDDDEFNGEEAGNCLNKTVKNTQPIYNEPFPFSATIEPLSVDIPYYFQACGRNADGIRCGVINDFTPAYSAPFVDTLGTESITADTAVAKGEVKSNGGKAISWRGICFNPANDDDPCSFDQPDGDDADWCVEATGIGEWVIGEFSVTIDYNLEPGDPYRICAFAHNEEGWSHGEAKTFSTTITAPYNITTNAATNIGPSSAVSGGNIGKSGGASVNLRGVCWKKDADPINTFPGYKPEEDPKCTEDGGGTGPFTSNILPSTIGLWGGGGDYHIRAYARNSVGIGWGDEKTFPTAAIEAPTVNTVTDNIEIHAESIIAGGYVEDHGGASLGQVGIVCRNESPGSEEEIWQSVPIVFQEEFSVEVTGLHPGTPYSIQAFATNGDLQTGYGDLYSFYTLGSDPPQVGPTVLSSYGVDWAEFTGNVTSTDSYTERGICYSSSTVYSYPSYAFNTPEIVCIPDDEQGEGDITIRIEGLKTQVTYYALLYATNDSGANLGLGDPEVSFRFETCKVYINDLLHNFDPGSDPLEQCQEGAICESTCKLTVTPGNCDGNGGCQATTTQYATSDGKVCYNGSWTDSSANAYCDMAIQCNDHKCSASRWYRGCTTTGSTCTDTKRIQWPDSWTASTSFAASGTEYKTGILTGTPSCNEVSGRYCDSGCKLCDSSGGCTNNQTVYGTTATNLGCSPTGSVNECRWCDNGTCKTISGIFVNNQALPLISVYCESNSSIYHMWPRTAAASGYSAQIWGGDGEPETKTYCYGVYNRPACNYCEGINIAGYSGWSLPTYPEYAVMMPYSSAYDVNVAVSTSYWTSQNLDNWYSLAAYKYPHGAVQGFTKRKYMSAPLICTRTNSR